MTWQFWTRTGLAAGVATLAITAPTLGQEPLAVETVTATTAATGLTIGLTGTIEAASSVPVSFKSSGRIIEIEADVGDRVAAGDVLARIDPIQAEAAERAAAAQTAAAAASLTQAELARERAADLLARGVGTQAELDSAQASLLAAQAAYDQTSAARNKASQTVEDTVLTAPVAGIVTSRNAEVGQIAGTEPVLTLAQDGAREAVFYAPNNPQIDTMMGARFELRPLETNGPGVSAVITEISPLASSSTGTVLVRGALDGDGPAMGLGTPVSTSFIVPMPDAISLPWSALATMDGAPAVWRVDPATATVSLVPVEISRFTTTTVEVLSGLSEGDQIVSTGSHQLFPGRIVTTEGNAQ